MIGTPPDQPRRVLNIDIGGMMQRAYVGVRRAAAFLGLSEHFLEQELPESLNLGNAPVQLLPSPVSDDLKEQIKPAFRDWIIGNALRELDQFLSLMLDEGWDIAQAVRIAVGQRPPTHEWRRIHRNTNVSDKHKAVLEDIGLFNGPLTEDNACLSSLSEARNCLSHSLGVVTEERAPSGALVVKWIALQTQIRVGDVVTVLSPENLPFDAPEGGHVEVHVHIKEKPFQVGEHVAFTPSELLEICLFINMAIDRFALAVEQFARDAGIQFPPRPEADPPPVPEE